MKKSIFIPSLIILLVFSALLSCCLGALPISFKEIGNIIAYQLHLTDTKIYTEQQEAVLLTIRLPRVIMGLLVGGALAISGASMQGLFQNPLTEPGLIGVSSGATLGAVFVIMMKDKINIDLPAVLDLFSLPIASFITALVVTFLVYKVSQIGGKTIISTVLLAGIAINALATAFTGMMIYYASETQLRTITFWTFGSLGGATWTNVKAIAPFILASVIIMLTKAKSLNAFSMGESNAGYIGINTEKVKKIIIICTAMAVGASVAVSGIIMFVGLVVPHIIRLIAGPDHRHLLWSSALLGSVLLLLADIVARTIFKPSEVPIGIVTSLIGAPFFMFIILNERKKLKFL